MGRVRVKICGITRPEDAVSAADAGVDAIGLVFYESSPRYVDSVKARAIINACPPFICKIGLFVDQDQESIARILDEVPLDMLQFHGNETPEQCNRFEKPYIKAIRMSKGIDVQDYIGIYQEASALLLDTHVKGVAGGTGRVFDWTTVPADLKKPVVLAGGLTPENVFAAIRQVAPYAVDVSGGVETEKGIKDQQKIISFIRAVHDASII